MSELMPGHMDVVFRCFTGPPDETCANVNRALKEYAVVAWNWATVDGRVVLSALMVSQREIRKAQLAMMGPQIGGHRQ